MLQNVGDTAPFIRVPKWDFEWQGFYTLKNPVKLPKDSKVHGKGVFDNKANNIHNPNSPPQTIGAGLNTSDEMFLIYSITVVSRR